MRNPRTAVLGGSGFIGRYVVKRLAARGAVIAVGCRNAERAKFLKPMGNVGQIATLEVGIGDEKALSSFLAGNIWLVNAVGILAERGRQRFDLVHRAGPALLARLARAAGIERFVHLSAIGADARSPSAYARSKAEGEAAVLEHFPTATILRPSVVFGPEDQLFNRLAEMALYSPALPLIGGGETRFQPVHVGDVAEAVVRCLEDPVTEGRTYELGGPTIYTFREIVELVLAEIHRKRFLVAVPFGLAAFQAKLLSPLPSPPLTEDQVLLLQRDNVVSAGALGLADLGIAPTAVEGVLPTYLDRFRRGGWYERQR